MADGGGKNGAKNDAVELEAMRKDSSSWQPCQVSLCSKGFGLILQYGDNDLGEIIADKQEVIARIRVRSAPLQGDDCSSLRQGDYVLATKKSDVKSVFYDAQVEEAIHVRHSKRTHCRCSFTVKWLHQALEEEAQTVPASAVMKLATKSINLHPAISTFFNMLESAHGLDNSSYSIVDVMNIEMDINVLLEKQIEEISNSTDVSQKKISKDLVFGLEVDLTGQSNGSATAASYKDPSVAIPLLNNLKGYTGSENKLRVETIIETPPASVPSIKEEFKGNSLPLNPLAARAALASLRSNISQSVELSVQSNVGKGDITSDYNSAKLLYGSKCCSFSAVDLSSTKDDFSLKISATLGGKSPNYKNIVKTLFSTSNSPQIDEFPNVSSGAQVNEMEKKNTRSKNKIIQPPGTRFTCSKIQRSNGKHESTQMDNIKEARVSSIKPRRVTRSTVNEGEKIAGKEYNATFEENVQNECIKIDACAQNTVAQQDCLSDNQKLVDSPIAGETRLCSAEDNKSLLEEDGMVTKAASQKRTFVEDTEKHNYPKRLTRSAAREETEKNNVQPNLKFRKTNLSESNKGNASAKSNKVKTTPNNAESVVGISQGISGKSASSKKQVTQFSPRLRFLPRARSQSKAS